MISFDYFRSMASAIGSQGLEDKDLEREILRTGQTVWNLPRFGFCELPYADPGRILHFAREQKPRNVVQIGIGGSALGATAIASALRPREGARYFALDNVDPEETADLLDQLRPEETIYHVVTKSGETTETLSTMMLALERAPVSRFVVTTGSKGFLRRFAQERKIPIFDIPENVGGRFSVLSPVGLLPAALLDVDVETLLAGAREADETCRKIDPHRNPAFLLAAIPYLLDRLRSKPIHVMMPYARALRDTADWWRQLWAESLGKSPSAGPLPVLALGATDQHSQIQLYNEGPNDKWILFLVPERYRSDPVVPSLLSGEPACDYLQGKSFSEILRALQRGTEDSLTANGRPNATISIPEIDARALGALFYTLEMATTIAGTLYGVDPFDQPGVEAGKRAAFSYLGRAGYPPPSSPPAESPYRV